MDILIAWISEHAYQAHWYLFGAIILAGFNIPFPIDLLAAASAILAATIIPDHVWILFTALLTGCYLSAMCSYWLGRTLGHYLPQMKYLSKLFSQKRMEKIHYFYKNYGLVSLILGRFIPFGVRNCIFMSSGMSKVPFVKFIAMDALACSLWSSTLFFLFYLLSKNHTLLWHYLKTFNLFIFLAFSVTGIGIIWYKNRKKVRV